MAVRETEKYLPSGGAAGLGQCNETGLYALVSYLTTPIPVGVAIDYVVFATEGASADTYDWTFNEIPSGKITTLQTKVGVASYQPTQQGALEVSVSITVGANVVARLGLTQVVIESGEHLFTLVDVLAAMIGDRDSTLEVCLALKPYILEAVRDPANARIPTAFLASVVYAESNRVRSSKRAQELEDAARVLNDSLPVSTDELYTPTLGVCQLSPERVAMVAVPPESGAPTTNTYIDWTDPTNEIGRAHV